MNKKVKRRYDDSTEEIAADDVVNKSEEIKEPKSPKINKGMAEFSL